MRLEEMIRNLPWTIEERRYILGEYLQYKQIEKKILDLIAFKSASSCFGVPEYIAFAEISYDPEIVSREDGQDINDRLIYKSMTLSKSELVKMLSKVIRDFIDECRYPVRFTMIIGEELQEALVSGTLPKHQMEFKVGQVKVVYSPKIKGIVVIE